jgi:SAM-dependent methyltransferase
VTDSNAEAEGQPASGYVPDEYWQALVAGQTGGELDEVGWEDMGRSFNALAYRLRGRALTALLERDIRDHRNPRVFEAGYGVGYYLAGWQRLGAKCVVGVDISASARNNCAARFPDFDLRQGDVSRVAEWADYGGLRGSFDVVTAIDVIYHLVDEEAATRALASLAALVAPGGVLVVTDKFVPGGDAVREAGHVVRRPLPWYEQVVARGGLRFDSMVPVFWCMDKPMAFGKRTRSFTAASILWAAMRAATKCWPRNSTPQLAIGTVAGRAGLWVDRLIVPRLTTTPNLTAVAFRRAAAG